MGSGRSTGLDDQVKKWEEVACMGAVAAGI